MIINTRNRKAKRKKVKKNNKPKQSVSGNEKLMVQAAKRFIIIYGIKTYSMESKQSIYEFLRIAKRDFNIKEKDPIKAYLEIYNLNPNGNVRRIKKKVKVKKEETSPFYRTDEWKKLRLDVLRTYGRRCMKCKTTKGIMHVDHIFPRSKYPEMELMFSNMQVLCKECNMEKSNKHFTDYRSKKTIKNLTGK